MESIAIVTSLIVAALVVMITYMYASKTAPPSIHAIITWIVVTFQRGLNTLAGIFGQSPLFTAVHQIGATAAPIAKGAMGRVEAGARGVEEVLMDAEQAVAATVTPGAVLGSGGGAGPLGAAVDSSLGYCFVGRSGPHRVCAPVSRQSGCMSGEYFGSLEQCRLNSGPRRAA